MSILAHKETRCCTCGVGREVDQVATAANARRVLGMWTKQRVADEMKISGSYLGDMMCETPRRDWNADMADRFEAAVKKLMA